jgi:transposase
MRGEFREQSAMFSYLSTEGRIPAKHPLRLIRAITRDVLGELSASFSRLYSKEGRPSIPPEQLLSALLVQVLFGIRSERLLMEQLNYNLLFRWFVGLSPDGEVWDASVFSKNRERLIDGKVLDKFMAKLLEHPKVRPLLSDEHFSVDGTLIEAWASHKSFKRKDGSDGNGEDFHGEKRTNETHQSATDPEARLYRKSQGQEAKLCFMGHVLMENRNGLPVAAMVTEANGTAEREAAEAMLKQKAKDAGGRITVGADKAYDAKDHVEALRQMNVTPHVAQNNGRTKTGKQRKSAIDGRTTRHIGYAISQVCRKMTECVFGWGKGNGTMRKAKQRGLERVEGVFKLNVIGYTLVRLPKLAPA